MNKETQMKYVFDAYVACATDKIYNYKDYCKDVDEGDGDIVHLITIPEELRDDIDTDYLIPFTYGIMYATGYFQGCTVDVYDDGVICIIEM